jgi:diguanylate cyclase (GGDEF)-like protein
MPLLSMGKLRVLLLAAAIFLATSLLELSTNQELCTAQIFAIPVLVVAWGAGWRWGMVFSALATIVLILTPGMIARPYSMPAYFWIDLFVAFGSFSFFGFVGDRLNKVQTALYGLSRRDNLTGLANRIELQERMRLELMRHRRLNKPFTVVFIDCDNFKEINDRHSHAVGDRTLQVYAERLRERLRAFDITARYGGDEFVVVLPETDLDAAQMVCADLKLRLELPIPPEGIVAGCSIGAVVYDRMPPDAEAAIAYADESMYAGKRRGDGQLNIALFSELP